MWLNVGPWLDQAVARGFELGVEEHQERSGVRMRHPVRRDGRFEPRQRLLDQFGLVAVVEPVEHEVDALEQQRHPADDRGAARSGRRRRSDACPARPPAPWWPTGRRPALCRPRVGRRLAVRRQPRQAIPE
jgi:hypothetical protein